MFVLTLIPSFWIKETLLKVVIFCANFWHFKCNKLNKFEWIATAFDCYFSSKSWFDFSRFLNWTQSIWNSHEFSCCHLSQSLVVDFLMYPPASPSVIISTIGNYQESESCNFAANDWSQDNDNSALGTQLQLDTNF